VRSHWSDPVFTKACVTNNLSNVRAACNNSTKIRNVAYYESWASVRPCDAYLPSEIDPSPWTHVNFAFAWVDHSGHVILSKANDTVLYDQIQGLRKRKKDLELFIAVGGYAVGAAPFAKLAATSNGRSDFIKSACSFADKYGFDGVDLDWEYPADMGNGGSKSDTANFVALVKEFRQQCRTKALTITVPGGLCKWSICFSF
jgi:chitinase